MQRVLVDNRQIVQQLSVLLWPKGEQTVQISSIGREVHVEIAIMQLEARTDLYRHQRHTANRTPPGLFRYDPIVHRALISRYFIWWNRMNERRYPRIKKSRLQRPIQWQS